MFGYARFVAFWLNYSLLIINYSLFVVMMLHLRQANVNA